MFSKSKAKLYIFSGIVILLLIFNISCGYNEQPSTEAVTVYEQTDTPGTDETTDSVIISSEKDVIIIKPLGCPAIFSEKATGLSDAICKLTGKTPTILTDKAAVSIQLSENSIIIFIGCSARFGNTQEALGKLRYGEYTYSARNNKICISGWFDSDVTLAVDSLISYIGRNSSDGTVKIPPETIHCSDRTLSALPLFAGNTPDGKYDCGDGRKMVIYSAADDMFYGYADTLASNGFAENGENKIGNNIFRSYVNSEYTVYTVLTCDKKVRLMIEPLRKTTGINDNYITGMDSSITQLGLYTDSTTEAGMSYVIQLADGSYIIIDGGYEKDADELYRVLLDRSPDKKIVIAAWIITHAHGDHIGCFISFTDKYADKVKVERFICNYPSSGQASITGDAPDAELSKIYMKKYSDSTVIKAFPGEKFNIRNAVVTVYYTYELYAPNNLTYYNDCSLVFSVELEGTVTMFLGDISPNSAPVVASLYKDVLKCNILQIAHHGYAGNNPSDYVPLYTYLEPEYILWPSAMSVYETRIKMTHTQPFTDKVKKFLVADNRNITVKVSNGSISVE